MARTFTVPQFVDVESKVIGAITARQFMIMLAGSILIGICYKIFTFWIFVILGILIFSISGIFAFAKINGRPFHFFVLNFIQTSKRPNIRVWDNRNSIKDQEEIDVEKVTKEQKKEEFEKEALSLSKLSELTLVVDTQGVYKGKKNKE